MGMHLIQLHVLSPKLLSIFRLNLREAPPKSANKFSFDADWSIITLLT
jgi:hypothetical protein